ncbi:MAG: U32 family peptidase [Clostridiales bacterium]|jgi:putative protease|nr:U32 family peptidase [Clostridiales bacterium]
MELCAPAGNLSSFYSAVHCGANAVYLGLKEFSLRSKAENFDAEELKALIEYAHLFDARVFLALNSCIKPIELRAVEGYLERVKGLNLDAYILTDIGLIERVKRLDPAAAIHISTQAGIHNRYGAKFMEDAGADRVVLSRETDLETIADIRANTSIELEVFVHGALCVSFSSACLYSSLTTGKSGNRGACTQPCRLNYRRDMESGYYLSPKDLCLIEHLDALKKAGANAVKIEGRLKRPEYVAECVGRYRAALDGKRIDGGDIDALKKIYNRGGFSTGYLFGNDVIESAVQNHMGLKVGEIESVSVEKDAKYSTIRLISEYSIAKGDGYKLFRKKKECGGGEVAAVERAQDGRQILTLNNADALRGDAFHITSDTRRLAALRVIERKIELSLYGRFKTGESAELTATAKNISVTVCGDTVERAEKAPVDFETIKERLLRVNEKNDVFRVNTIEIDADTDIFLPLSKLNELRRSALAKLRAVLLKRYDGDAIARSIGRQKISANSASIPLNTSQKRIAAEVSHEEQIVPMLGACAPIIYAPREYEIKVICGFLDALTKNGIETKPYLKLPLQADKRDLAIIENVIHAFRDRIGGLSGENPYALMLSKKYALPYFAGLFHNVYNDGIIEAAARIYPNTDFLLSPELNAKELREIRYSGAYVYSYGRLPMMNFKHCPNRSACSSCTGKVFYSDGKYKYDIVRTRVKNCYHTMYNPPVLNLSKYPTKKSLYLDFSGTEEGNIEEILTAFLNGTPYQNPNLEFTSGHFKRGVE